MTFIVFFSSQDNGKYFHRNVSDIELWLSGFESVLDGGSFHCQAGNMIGTSSQSPAVTVTVESKQVFFFFFFFFFFFKHFMN